VTLLGDEFEIDGQKLDPNVTERIVGAWDRLIGSMNTDEGAGRSSSTCGTATASSCGRGARVEPPAEEEDARREEDPTAAWARFGAMRLVFDGVLWRLAGVSGFRVLTLTFEDEVASLVRRHTRAMTASRGEKTRAEFIGLAASKVKEIAVVYRSPEEQVRQNVDKPDDSAERKGLSHGAHLTIKGVPITAEQRRNVETRSRSPTASEPGSARRSRSSSPASRSPRSRTCRAGTATRRASCRSACRPR
jgi:hypothetical protein